MCFTKIFQIVFSDYWLSLSDFCQALLRSPKSKVKTQRNWADTKVTWATTSLAHVDCHIIAVSICVGYLEGVGRHFSKQGMICFRINPLLSSLKVHRQTTFIWSLSLFYNQSLIPYCWQADKNEFDLIGYIIPIASHTLFSTFVAEGRSDLIGYETRIDLRECSLSVHI